MGSKYRIKRIFKPLVIWIAKQFEKFKITPNQVSLLAFIMAICGSIMFFFLHTYWGSFVFGLFIFIAGIFDGVDGTLARLTKSESILGGYYDSIMDRYADVCIIFVFLGHYSYQLSIIGLPLLCWIALAMVGSIMVSYTRARAEADGEVDCDVGLGARSERLIIIVIFAFLNLAYVGLVIITFISHLTVIYRIYFVHKKLKN